MGITEQVAKFVAHQDLTAVDADVRHLAKRSLLDGLGLAVAGARSEGSRIIRDHLTELGARGSCTVVGTELTLPARLAAFANGFAIHADDYDDTQLAVASDRVYGLLTHPTAPVLPAALALGESERLDGADTLLAYLLGVEVATKVAEAIDPRHYDHGFHSTATAGAIGAGAAAARGRGLDAERTGVCLGIAASQAGGLRENFGTMTKPFHAARAAESGMIAADLAARGFSAASTILEADRGFFRAAGGGWSQGAIDGRLGAPWTFADPGISIKPHPSGSLTHPGMGAMLDLILEHDLMAADVERVRVGTNRHMPNALIHHQPENELQAKFSMEFCMAILLLDRRAGLAEFTDDVVQRPDVRALIERIDFGRDDEAEAAGYHTMTTIIRVTTKDGRELEARAAFGKGSPQNPMSDGELTAKFLECLEWGGYDAAVGREVASRVFAIEEEPSTSALLARLQDARTR
jgi:2-methylcitrate dehydratase PrpD